MTKEALQIALNALTDFDYDKRIKAIESIKEALKTKNEYERGFIDGMQKQMQSSVDKAVNAMSKREWVWLTDKEVDECLQGLPTQTIDVYARSIEIKIKDKNT